MCQLLLWHSWKIFNKALTFRVLSINLFLLYCVFSCSVLCCWSKLLTPPLIHVADLLRAVGLRYASSIHWGPIPLVPNFAIWSFFVIIFLVDQATCDMVEDVRGNRVSDRIWGRIWSFSELRVESDQGSCGQSVYMNKINGCPNMCKHKNNFFALYRLLVSLLLS